MATKKNNRTETDIYLSQSKARVDRGKEQSLKKIIPIIYYVGTPIGDEELLKMLSKKQKHLDKINKKSEKK